MSISLDDIPVSLSDIPALDDVLDDAGLAQGGDDGTTFVALLAPANNSGVLGASLVELSDDGTVTVDIQAGGLTPNQIHPQHIHGFADDQPSQLATIALDADRDGFVEDSEGEVVIGPVILSLTASGDVTNVAVSQDFPAADAEGRLSFRQSYRFDLTNPEQAAIFQELQDRLEGRVVQLHGLDVPPGEGAGTQGEVDGTGGYIAPLPVADGVLHPLPEQAQTMSFDELAGLSSSAVDSLLG